MTPEKASLPPHCTPTTRSDAGQVSRRRRLSRARVHFGLGHDGVDHRLEAGEFFVLQADDVVGYDLDRDAAFGEQTLGRELRNPG